MIYWVQITNCGKSGWSTIPQLSRPIDLTSHRHYGIHIWHWQCKKKLMQVMGGRRTMKNSILPTLAWLISSKSLLLSFDIYFDEHVVSPYGMGHSVVPYGDYDNYVLVRDYNKWYNTYYKINKRKNTINNILHSGK